MFFFRKKKTEATLAETTTTYRHLEIAADSMQLIESTLNPSTFFGRCDDIAFSEEQITGEPSAFLLDTQLQTTLQIDFINRVLAAGRKHILETAMPKYAHKLTSEALSYYEENVGMLL